MTLGDKYDGKWEEGLFDGEGVADSNTETIRMISH